ncbi:hypothetical protein ACI799_02665 [Blastococcus sp. SYSU DS0753]
MRIRKLALLTAAATLPLGLTACGGASLADFCEEWTTLNQLGEAEPAQAQDAFEELAESVPDEAGAEVEDAARFLAATYPPEGDLRRAVENGSVTQEEADRFQSAIETVAAYADQNCAS